MCAILFSVLTANIFLNYVKGLAFVMEVTRTVLLFWDVAWRKLVIG